ncbi:hypothetical protein [Streptomyces anulatus]|uniref:hypothetical protein n=1 Tax=Streptomyces anulatus TaxID=1892 RepID=UPI002E2F53B7|nr:hypothetical protein [Streptomyces anulatus]WTD30663.1 hypothetical protein OH737_39545 [Streptomyces anulatus]
MTGYAVRTPDYGSTVMTSTARSTTQDILDAEAYVQDQALTRHGEDAAALTDGQAAAAVDVFQVAVGFELSEEQRAAVTTGLAGTGLSPRDDGLRRCGVGGHMAEASAEAAQVFMQERVQGAGIAAQDAGDRVGG